MIAAVAMVVMLSGILIAETEAGTLYTNYCPQNGLLQVEYAGPKIPTWGCHDVEGIQWDRLVLAKDGQPQIYLVVYDGSGRESRAVIAQLPVSKLIIFYAEMQNVACGTDFQIKALVWENDQKIWKYWAIGPGEPIHAEYNPRNTGAIERPLGWNFITMCGCQ